MATWPSTETCSRFRSPPARHWSRAVRQISQERRMSSTGDYIQAASDATDEATGHLANAIDAHKRGEAQAVSLEHGHVLRCLRSAKSAFKSLAAEAAEQDLINTKTIQTSSGVGPSTGSEGGRGSP